MWREGIETALSLDPAKVEEMAERYGAPRGAELVLMGWAVDPDRPSRRIDLLLNGEPVAVPEPGQRQTLIGLAVCRTTKSATDTTGSRSAEQSSSDSIFL